MTTNSRISRPPEHRLQQDIDTYWSTYAKAYDAHQQRRLHQAGEARAWARVWQPALPAFQADVLDLGTGSGHAALTVARLGHRVTGIDLAMGMLQEARSHAQNAANPPVFRCADAFDPPFPRHSFDVAITRFFMWTLRSPLVALQRWHELLRPGGRLVIVDGIWFPKGEGLALPDSEDQRPDQRMQDFQRAYQPALDMLPLAQAPDMNPLVNLVEEAGFMHIQVDGLDEILDRDRRFGAAPNHQPQLLYRIQARRE